MGGPSSELAAHRDLGRWQAELRRHPEPCQPPPGRAFPSRGEGTPAELGTKREKLGWCGWLRADNRVKNRSAASVDPPQQLHPGPRGPEGDWATVTAASGLAPPPSAAPPPASACRSGAGPRPATSSRRGRADRVFADAQAPPPPPFPSDPERRSEPERQSSGSLSGVHLVRRPLAARSRAESLANAEARRAQSSGPVGAQASPRASSLGRDVAVEA